MICTCSWELEMLLSTDLYPQTCILTPHWNTLLPCEILHVGCSPPLWFLPGASCRLVWSISKGGRYCSLPGHPAHSSVQPPSQQNRKSLHHIKISHVSTHRYCLCPPLGKLGLHLLLTPLSSYIHQGVLPESPLLRAEQAQLSQQLPPLRNSSHTISWQPSTSPALVFHFLGMWSPKWGRVNKHRD